MAIGLVLAVAALPGLGADAVVEFYRTQPDAEQYVLHEMSLYELRRAIGEGCARRLNFWRRVAGKFPENPDVLRRCGDRKQWWEKYREREETWLEENVAQRMADGNRLFHYESRDAKGEDNGMLVLANDGTIKWKKWEIRKEILAPGWTKLEEIQWQRRTEAVRNTVKEQPGKLESDAADAFLRIRSDAANHALHATSCHGLEEYLLDVVYPCPWRPRSGDPLAYGPWRDVPGALEVDEAENAALQAWLAPREAIVEKLRAEAEPTDRLYWDEFDDGEHRRAGLLWLRWDGSVRQEWPCFGEDGDPAGAGREK